MSNDEFYGMWEKIWSARRNGREQQITATFLKLASEEREWGGQEVFKSPLLETDACGYMFELEYGKEDLKHKEEEKEKLPKACRRGPGARVDLLYQT